MTVPVMRHRSVPLRFGFNPEDCWGYALSQSFRKRSGTLLLRMTGTVMPPGGYLPTFRENVSSSPTRRIRTATVSPTR